MPKHTERTQDFPLAMVYPSASPLPFTIKHVFTFLISFLRFIYIVPQKLSFTTAAITLPHLVGV